MVATATLGADLHNSDKTWPIGQCVVRSLGSVVFGFRSYSILFIEGEHSINGLKLYIAIQANPLSRRRQSQFLLSFR
jgi:hypothetical protein